MGILVVQKKSFDLALEYYNTAVKCSVEIGDSVVTNALLKVIEDMKRKRDNDKVAAPPILPDKSDVSASEGLTA